MEVYKDYSNLSERIENMKRILVIDDEVMIVDVMKVILEDMGYQVIGFQSSQEGEKDALENDYDLILIDLRMPGEEWGG
ncbi:unnamed protein product, partial [marine sediment metagenome]